MDPDATLARIDAALHSRDEHELEQIDDLCRDLAEWLDRGGFPPDWAKHPLGHSYFLSREAGGHR